MCKNGSVSNMAYVTESDGDETPTVLIVNNNAMSITRLSNIFKAKEFKIVVCEDGDKAVDEYIRLDPELVVLSLDLPSLDGHIAALEMREHGGEKRIIFVAPKRQAQLAADAAFSAGAVACLQKPIIGADLDKIWDAVLGPIPDAPGLEDLDSLYPEGRIKPEDDTGPLTLPPLPGLPALPMPNEDGTLPPLTLPPLAITPVIESGDEKPKRKMKGLKKMFLLVVVLASAVGYWYYKTIVQNAPLF
jgi:CheY-like chemotaxis protein